MAVDDEILWRNPFNFELREVLINDSVKREAISRKDMRIFLEFLKADKHFSKYYEAVYILFHTGLRIIVRIWPYPASVPKPYSI